jgi:hypothetical protein
MIPATGANNVSICMEVKPTNEGEVFLRHFKSMKTDSKMQGEK